MITRLKINYLKKKKPSKNSSYLETALITTLSSLEKKRKNYI